ncbi:uncharacterized protein F5891DRAFT_1172328 [Suillus fuscotomentosus]|uniref:Uncharacterized protein n=1 Tax=Suillus fuscotomentosus TaxID=1912939 RepID=A0AAD4E968_9AGAM|nr:uncharacterized protein F5891DRAFT_1174731 [Suillus fuscotomentosus]XP_041224350.1 uncharacterized protein F5891DRAFT_1174054 [Suillus fuscotomentosus]XP_041227470.1 uncharacterized protein F5891DRAFT_1172328 [Suillus fuscotomentosus]KAG1897403.1 hypothetical protein F5891DRAFT_1174731 [Suillus fuscotomentosus]KAG1898774.1 hypothetical protein F5891DRAFT_1174054 [Suillus fuscotomentosus]KAG1901895.1 hypothetical protein F5891DRAFT_1172328 [Suillus fuscotomentosus]
MTGRYARPVVTEVLTLPKGVVPRKEKEQGRSRVSSGIEGSSRPPFTTARSQQPPVLSAHAQHMSANADVARTYANHTGRRQNERSGGGREGDEGELRERYPQSLGRVQHHQSPVKCHSSFQAPHPFELLTDRQCLFEKSAQCRRSHGGRVQLTVVCISAIYVERMPTASTSSYHSALLYSIKQFLRMNAKTIPPA